MRVRVGRVDRTRKKGKALTADPKTASKGYPWSIAMLALMIFEALALIEGLMRDSTSGWADLAASWLGIYLVVHATETVLLAAGILLVAAGRYRVGGVLQIACSAVHVPTGVIGVVGGLKAYRYPDRRRVESTETRGSEAADESWPGGEGIGG
jgi:hypothetical protein